MCCSLSRRSSGDRLPVRADNNRPGVSPPWPVAPNRLTCRTGLTADQVLQQLAGYTDEARRQYLASSPPSTTSFPLAAGLSLAAVGAFCLRRGFPGVYAAMVRRQLFPLFLAGSLFDWCENVAAIDGHPDLSGHSGGPGDRRRGCQEPEARLRHGDPQLPGPAAVWLPWSRDNGPPGACCRTDIGAQAVAGERHC